MLTSVGEEINMKEHTDSNCIPGTVTVREALEIARNRRDIATPGRKGLLPTLQEALDIIQQDLKTCGFNWLTGMQARDVLMNAISRRTCERVHR